MNQRDYEKAIEAEVEQWPGVVVTFGTGGKHPKAKFEFGGKQMSHPYAGTPSDAVFGVHAMLGDMRRVMKKLGATRDKPEPSKDEDEAPYRKPNDGAAKRQPVRVGAKTEPEPDIAAKLVTAGAATPEQAKAAKDPETLFETLDEGPKRSRTNSLMRPSVSGVPVTSPVKFEPSDEDAALREAFLARVAGITDGIYFDLPEDVYHAVPRLSCSGIQKLCVSAGTFWAGSWLDPDRPEEGEDDTKFRIIGRAYHCARLEPHLFEASYCRKPDKAELPEGSLRTGDQMGAELAGAGLKKSGSVAEQAKRLWDNGFPREKIWHFVMEDFEASRAGRIALEAKDYDKIVTDMERIRMCGPVAELLTGGEAEVSIFWTDEHGIKMKSRLDYLTRDWIADLKTFDNSKRVNIDEALANAVRYNRYYIQPAIYREAVEAIRTQGLQIIEASTDDQRALIAHLQIKPSELKFWFIFQEKGGIPNLLAKEFPIYNIPWTTIFNEQITDDQGRRDAVREATKHRSAIFMRGVRDALNAKKEFALYSLVYEPGEPWFPIKPVGRFSDEDFHPYWLNPELK